MPTTDILLIMDRGWKCGALGALVLTALAGCANAEEPEVRDVASSFAAGDAEVRCRLLAPASLTSLLTDGACPDVIGRLPLGSGDVTSVDVWGDDALVHLTDDTLFLTRDGTGWRVSAAACRAAGAEQPYECQLEAA